MSLPFFDIQHVRCVDTQDRHLLKENCNFNFNKSTDIAFDMSDLTSSDSDSSDDEITAHLREAVDSTLICDAMFTPTDSKEKPKQLGKAAAQEFQRHLVDAEDHKSALNVPKSMQDFFYNKMSMNIASSIEFVDIDGVCGYDARTMKSSKTRDKNESALKLLQGTELTITHIDETVTANQPIITKQTKPSIVRRQIEPNEMTESEKLRIVAIDGESIMRGNDFRNRNINKKFRTNKIYNYREKNCKFYLIEPTNEFSAKRKKNNWTESKISKWKPSS